MRRRTREELRGSLASASWAAKKASSVLAGLARVALRVARFSAYLATRASRFLFRSMMDFLAMFVQLLVFLCYWLGVATSAAAAALDLRKGMPRWRSRSRPSSSVSALVTMVMSRPIFWRWLPSACVSGKMVWSAMPRE